MKFTEEQLNDWFEKFWSIYPRKVGKGKARQKFGKALEKVRDANEIRVGVELYKKQIEVLETELQFVAHPATWLFQERWADDYITERASVKPSFRVA